MPRLKTDRILRDPDFGARFREACDNSPHCPAKHDGRYVWIVKEFSRHGNAKISNETCRKWHEGEVRPRRDKIPILAKILNVDSIWLETGSGSPVQQSAIESPLHRNQLNGAPGTFIANSNQRNSVSIALRDDLTVEVFGLPFDLTKKEAQKIANIVIAHASE